MKGLLSIMLLVGYTSVAVVAERAWWADAFAYQVYPVSFMDSNGDGFGDLNGITEKVGYLKSLGVTTVWLSPIYKSPNYDWGYDISDFKEIDPVYGNLTDFETLMKELRQQGMYLIVDFVPNHTSDQHPWFVQSVQRVEPYTDYYVWQDARGYDHEDHPIPPNNWVDRSATDSCWAWHPERKQFFLHQYLIQQPDLNFRNPKVISEITDVMRFWLDKGIDGFRVDSVPFLFEDKEYKDEVVDDATGKRLDWWEINHVQTQNLPENYNHLMEWGKIFEEYIQKDGRKRVMFLEVYASIEKTVSYFMGPRIDGDPQFMIPFNFDMIRKIQRDSSASEYKSVIDDWLTHLPQGAVSTWVVGNHDNPRVSTRLGPEFTDAINMIASVLPGVRFIYQGEELGMEDTYVSYEEAKDSFGKYSGPEFYEKEGRDPERTPMQWDDSDNAGFSTNAQTWLPVNPDYWRVNVAAQMKAEHSHLKVIQALAKMRDSATFHEGDTKVEVVKTTVLVITRELKGHDSYILVVNTGSFRVSVLLSEVGLAPEAAAHILIASVNSIQQPSKDVLSPEKPLTLRPKAAVLLVVQSPGSAPSKR